MPQITYTRAEWSTIADMIAEADPGTVPPGLAERIEALLRATPESWPDEPCVLEVEPASAVIVERLARTRRGVADAERIIQDHQRDNPAASHRIELRSNGVSSVVAYLNDSTSLHRELQRHATRLVAARAIGSLVLIDQRNLQELATMPLLPEDGPGTRPA